MSPHEKGDSSLRRSRGRPRDWNDKTEQNTIKSLDRAMEVFEFLSESQGKALSSLAQETGQSPATVYRILITLENRGLVDFDPVDQVWNIGSRAFVIGARFLRRTSLVESARPIMRQLMEETGETANLGVERDGQVLFVSQVETNANIRAFFAPGTLSPMHASGIGKALLAQKTDEWLQSALNSTPMEVFTQFTLTDLEKLRADLQVTRTRGYSIDGEEKSIGMRCIAAPVFNLHEEAIAGISVSGPSTRLSEDKNEPIGRAVMAAAEKLSRALGAPR